MFDPDNVVSAEAGALWHLADLLAECSSAQALAEKTGGTDAENKAETRLKVIVGPHAGPWNGESMTKTEMETRFIEFQVTPPTEEGKSAIRSDGSFDRADESGEFMLSIRRYARDVEMNDQSDLYLWFLDQIGRLEQELLVRAENRECPRLNSITRVQGPAFPTKKKKSSQGEYIFTTHMITWGDQISNQ